MSLLPVSALEVGDIVLLVVDCVRVAVRVPGLERLLVAGGRLSLLVLVAGGSVGGAVVWSVTGGSDEGVSTAVVVVAAGGVVTVAGADVLGGGVADVLETPPDGESASGGMRGVSPCWAPTVERRTNPRSSKDRICILTSRCRRRMRESLFVDLLLLSEGGRDEWNWRNEEKEETN